MALDAVGLAPRLGAFLDSVRRLIPNLGSAPWHLGFPAGRGTVIGSELGQQVWEEPEAVELMEYLLADETLRAWFSPPPGFAPVELQFILASVVDRYAASHRPAGEFAAASAAEILEAMHHPNPACVGFALAHGVAVERYVELPYGLAVAPATQEQLRSLPARTGISQIDAMRLPGQPAMFLICSTAASRADFGAFAAMTALGFARIGLEHLRTAIWLATAVMPGRSDTFLWHNSPYPAAPFERIPALPEQRFVRGSTPHGQVTTIDGSLLWQAVARLGIIWNEAEGVIDSETMLSLWVAQTYVSPALEWADAFMTLLMSYATIDGLLLRKNDDDSRLGHRVAWLIGASDHDRRQIRKFITGLRELRGDIAHGERPDLLRLSTVLGRQVSEDELSDRFPILRTELQSLLRQRCLGLLRRVLVAYLWLVVDAVVDPENPLRPGLQAGVTRGAILDLLESASKNDSAAQRLLSRQVPEAARGRAA
jgi:hypothetical protein